MERLKERGYCACICYGYHLHSSMERLKGIECSPDKPIITEFTFQYGEIKSLYHRQQHRANRKFTFQYGEIKSIM